MRLLPKLLLVSMLCYICHVSYLANATPEKPFLEVLKKVKKTPPQRQPKILKKTLSSPELLASDIRAIKEKGKLTVAVRAIDTPPFFMRNPKGENTGAGVEFAMNLAQELGVTLELNRDAKSFDGVVDLVAADKADIGISKLSLTLERAQKVLYSKPYINLKKALLINRLELAKLRLDSPSVQNIFTVSDTKVADNKQKASRKIGVIGGSSYEVFAQRMFPTVEVVPFPTWGDAFNALEKGKVLAIFRDEFEVRRIIDIEPNAELNYIAVILKNEADPIMMVLPHGKYHLTEWINHYLTLTHFDLSVDSLFRRLKNYLKELKTKKQGS